MFLFEGNESNSQTYRSTPKKKNKGKDAEAKAAAKAKKAQQDDMESLQITFYEIESWIEKTSPVLAKMTKELDRVSKHFDKGKKKTPEIDLSSMQWTLTFQPNNSMRLETNIKSVEQLIDAVQKIQLVTETNDNKPTPPDEEDFDISSSASLSSSSTTIAEHSIEYWNLAMLKRPSLCLDQYQNCAIELSKLTEQVSPDQLSFVCQSYWNCLFPKFSSDWSTFWNRSDDPHRNQLCVDSALAMVFTHIIRHNKAACPNAQDLAYYYYEGTRQALVDYFDSPDAATVEAVLNTAMYSMIWKRYSYARLYLELAYRMIVQLGYHRQAQLPVCKTQRRRCIRLFLVLYYIDLALSTYSSGSLLVDDTAHDIDFYQLLPLEDPKRDPHTIIKDTFFVHLMELMKIHKKIQQTTRDYQEHPGRWTKKTQTLEVALATWLDRVPADYRATDIQGEIQQRSSLLLMLHYQMQWIFLHKIFLSSPTLIPTHQQRSHNICFDAANRIVIMAERIVQKYDWCVCQLFLSCVYQASTIFCKSILTRDSNEKYSKGMIRRIISILAVRRVTYGGLPDDLMECLNEFLEDNKTDNIQDLDQMLSDEFVQNVVYTDSFYNSPQMHTQCMKQEIQQ